METITMQDAVDTLATAVALIDEGFSAADVMDYITIQGRAVVERISCAS